MFWGDLTNSGSMDMSGSADGDNTFGANTNNVSYGNGNLSTSLDKTTLIIGAVVLFAVVFVMGRK